MLSQAKKLRRHQPRRGQWGRGKHKDVVQLRNEYSTQKNCRGRTVHVNNRQKWSAPGRRSLRKVWRRVSK